MIEVLDMGAKSLYLDTREKIITALVLANDIEAISKLLKDRESFERFSANWTKANLDEFMDKFTITDEKFNMTHNVRKISFWDDGKEYEVVCAIGAKYFRIMRKEYIDSNGVKHGDEYVGLDLKQPKVSGALRGKEAKAERNRLTHFKMSYRKGTV